MERIKVYMGDNQIHPAISTHLQSHLRTPLANLACDVKSADVADSSVKAILMGSSGISPTVSQHYQSPKHAVKANILVGMGSISPVVADHLRRIEKKKGMAK
jgi:hypothetical protein